MQSGNGAAPLNPGLVFEMVQSQQKTAALKAAIDLDVFRAVGEGPGDVASIARHCSASERGIRILCDFLVINGVLEKEDGRYKHTPTSAAFLDPRSPACMASVAQFLSHPALRGPLDNLADVVRTGRTTSSRRRHRRAGESGVGAVCGTDGADDGSDGCSARCSGARRPRGTDARAGYRGRTWTVSASKSRNRTSRLM